MYLSKSNIKEIENSINNRINNKQIIIYDNKNNELNNFKFKNLNISFNIIDKLSCFEKKVTNLSFLQYLFNHKYKFNLSIDNINCLNDLNKKDLIIINNKLTNPINATIIYDINLKQFKIQKEIQGTKFDINLLLKKIINNISNNNYIKIKLSDDLILKPNVISTDKDLLEKQNILNKYLEHSITYKFGKEIRTINKDDIHEWIYYKDKEIKFNKEKIGKYVDKLKKETDTYKKPRQFKTTNKGIINCSSVYYGYSIDREKEINEIINNLQSNKLKIEREPIYSKKGLYRQGKQDILNNYVEIDLSSQKLWLYKNNKLIVSSPIVTGNILLKHNTPSGIYSLYYKQKNAILRGKNYASKVSYWMPFNGGIGLHDAPWRSSFGGNIYKTNGSHGCINLPPNVARIIYNNIKQNTPIIIY